MSENKQISIDDLGVTQEQITAAILNAAANNEVIQPEQEELQDEKVHKIPFAFSPAGEDSNLDVAMSEEDSKKIKAYKSAKTILRSRAMSIIDRVENMQDYPDEKDIIQLISIITNGIRITTDIELLCEVMDDISNIGESCFCEFNSSENIINKLSKDEVLVFRKNM